MKREMILAALFLVAAPSLWGASDVPLAAERAARPVDTIGVRDPVPLGCVTDADCKDPNPDDCKGYKCVPSKSQVNPLTGEVTVIGKCSEIEIPNCPSCSDKYPGDGDAIKCCEAGLDPGMTPDKWKCCKAHFSEAADPAKYKCCMEHVTHGEDPGTAENPLPCNGCPECPKCPPPPKIDCDLIGDKMKDCCVAKGGLLWFVMSSCVEHGPGGAGDCTNIAEHITNSGTFQQCCLINNGTITGDINMCNNNWTPGGGPSPTGGTTTGTPTTPAALGACQVQCKDADCSIAVDTGGQGVGWVVSYSPPPGIGAVASVVLKQVEGPAMTAEEPAPSGTNALSIKTITDPSSLPSFIVYTAKPQSSLQGEYLPKFKLTVQLNDLADHELATLTCGNDTALEAKGSGGCGCSMADHMTTRDQIVAYAVMLVLFSLPQLLFRYARNTKKRTGDHDGN